MAITQAYTGSATVSTVEYSCPNSSTTLTPIVDTGVFQVFVDTSAMVAGDQYEFKVKEKIVAAGSQKVIYAAVLTGAMAEDWVTPSLVLMHGWDVTIKKLAGTDRSFTWSIRKVA